MQPEPDFSPGPPARFDWTWNIPTFIAVGGAVLAVGCPVVLMWRDAGIDKNNTDWRMKSVELEVASIKLSEQGDVAAIQRTVKDIADAQLQSARIQDRTQQQLEWMTQQQKKP